MKRSKGNRQRKRKSGSKSRANPPPSAIKYTGPVFTEQDLRQDQVIVRVLSVAGLITTNLSGNLAYTITNDPSGSPDWVSYTPLYEEYRVIAMELVWVPYCTKWGNVTNNAFFQNAVAYAASRNATAVASSVAAVMSYPSGRLTNMQTAWKLVIKMDNVSEASFFNVGGVGGTWAALVFSTGLSASTTYGAYSVRLRVQFRSPY